MSRREEREHYRYRGSSRGGGPWAMGGRRRHGAIERRSSGLAARTGKDQNQYLTCDDKSVKEAQELTGSGDDESDTSERHDPRRSLRGGHPEGRLLVNRPCRGERTTQDEQDVGKDASQHGRLDQAELVLLQGDDTDQEFDGVTECRVQEGRDALGQAHAELFGGVSQ